jgi:hypothetical protein
MVGSETISSTLEMYDSSCCLASNFLLKASSEFLNFSASDYMLDRVHVNRLEIRLLTVDHALNFTGRKLANRVGDGDVGTASGGLLSSSNLKDTVDIDLENNFENRVTSLHGRDWCESELSKGCVVLAVHTLTLVNRELNSLSIEGLEVSILSI